MIDTLRSLVVLKRPSSDSRTARYNYPAANSIRFFAVSDDADEESERAVVAAAGGAFVLLVLPERVVLLRE